MNEQALLLFAKNMIQNNRDRIPNTPWAQAAVNSIMNGDATAGAEIANNLCASNGTTREEAIKQASNFLKVPY